MLKCSRCGTNNAPNNQSCIACGQPLSGAPAGAPYGGGGGYPQQPGYPGTGGPPGGAPPGSAHAYGPPPGAAPGVPPGGYPGAYPGGGQPYPGAPPGGPPPGAPAGGAQSGYGPPPGGYAPPPGTPAPGGPPPGAQQGPGPSSPSPAPTGASPAPAQSGGRVAGFLLSYDIDPRGAFWTLRVGDNKVGRKGASEGLDIEIDHPTVSSNHAVIAVAGEDGVARIEDQRSANGTLLHEKAIAGQGQRELRDGDRVRFGAVNVIVKLVDPS